MTFVRVESRYEGGALLFVRLLLVDGLHDCRLGALAFRNDDSGNLITRRLHAQILLPRWAGGMSFPTTTSSFFVQWMRSANSFWSISMRPSYSARFRAL